MNDEALTGGCLSDGSLLGTDVKFCAGEVSRLCCDRTIHSLFEEQVARTPDAPAVVANGRSLTYADLNWQADRLALTLRTQGVGRDQLVGVCVGRSVEMFVALIATLKAGGAYVPLDPSNPAERLDYMLTDCKPRVLLVQSELRNRLPPTAAVVLSLDEQRPSSAEKVTNTLGTGVAPAACSSDLAYVIYTSGSTGRPKGVMIEHRSVAALWQGLEHLYASAPACERVALNASLNFDASVQQLVQLLSGRTVFVVPEPLRRDAPRLLQFLTEHCIQAIDCTPSQLRTWIAAGLLEDPATPVRLVLVGGEAIDPRLWQTLSRCARVTFYNVYGPTECTVDATAAHVNGESGEPHLGRPMLNRRIYILDHDNQPVPVGAVGEICIGGAGVGRGYLNRAELTAARFARDPFTLEPDGRMYRSGDLARWRADGTIEYLGRDDQQVKFRGFRIELGEIEAQLLLHDCVREAAVLLREDTAGEPRLVAYVTQQESRIASAVELRTFLRSRLPDYMIPAAFMRLERMPLSSSGKLDRRELPAPDAQAYARRTYEPPQGPRELALLRTCEDLLGIEAIGRGDNFFELGGHSLLIVQLLDRLRRIGLGVDVAQIYGCQTLGDLAGDLRPIERPPQVPQSVIPPGCESIAPSMLPLVRLQPQHIESIALRVPGGAGNIQDIYPLTPLQEGLLFHHVLDDRSAGTYVVATILSVSSRQGVTDLIAAFQAVIDRHDVLRTAILWEDLPQAVQVVQRRAVLPVEEFALDPSRGALAQLEEWLDSGAGRVEIRIAPLMRLRVAADANGAKWYVLLLAHHLTSDHVTLDLVTEEVVEHLRGREAHLPASMPYRDHVARVMAQARRGEAEAFFREKLGDIDEPTIPFGLADVRGDGTQIEQVYRSLDIGLARRVRAHARRLGVSAAAVFHAAWALVVAHTSERDDVVFGSILFGRLHGSTDAQRVLGLFINTLPLRVKLADVSAADVIVRVQRELAQLLDYEQTPLAIAQRCSGLPGSAPLFSTLLNYVHSQQNAAAQWRKAQGVQLLAYRERTNYPITISIEDLGEGFALDVQTDRRIPAERVAGYLQTAVESLVHALEDAPQAPAMALTILHAGERRRLIEQFNPALDTRAVETLIHELFERRVVHSPDAVAVMFEGESLSYAALNRRANRLARRLMQQGVQPDELVALCLERGLHLVVGILAILKAGGAYLPLDPNYPAERLSYMLTDARPRVLLTQTALRQQFSAATAALITIDDECSTDERDDDNVRVAGLRPEHLAYVIYTSGSTGRPKGVMVEHRNVTRLFAATADWFAFDARDVWTLFHSFAFDFSVWELWGALFYGGRVVVVPWHTARSPADFYRLICEQGVTVLNQTPSAFAQLCAAQESLACMRHALRVVVFGGEALELATLRAWVARNGDEQPRLVNMYGITETTVHVTYRRLTRQEIETEHGSLIGRPIPDLRVYLLDRSGQMVPIGVCGEIHVGGAGVARGYLNRPDLTAERFPPDTLAPDPDAHRFRRLYKSGDLARWRPDGTLEYLGRNDEQVKIRGFRIELGEIKSRLLEHPGVREAAVIVRVDAGERRLVAYVVADASEQQPAVAQLRSHLQQVLPEYMVPAAFVTVSALPLTSNGKLDRRALPPPDAAADCSQRYEAPDGLIEQELAAIWRELLGVQRIGRDENVFGIGGHSLLAMQVVGRIRVSLAVELPVRALFQFPTVRQLAAHIEQLRLTELCAAVAADVGDAEELLEQVASLPESEVQQRLKELRMEARS